MESGGAAFPLPLPRSRLVGVLLQGTALEVGWAVMTATPCRASLQQKALERTGVATTVYGLHGFAQPASQTALCAQMSMPHLVFER